VLLKEIVREIVLLEASLRVQMDYRARYSSGATLNGEGAIKDFGAAFR